MQSGFVTASLNSVSALELQSEVVDSDVIAGARGVSMLFSSGDLGVGDGSSDPEDQVCQTNNGRNETRFMPSFPARYSHDNFSYP